MRFQNRANAGRFLAALLREYCGRKDLLVLALPRGGVPVGYEVARALHAPLDVFLVRKLGLPGYEELAMGAIASGGARVLNSDVTTALGEYASRLIEPVTALEQKKLLAREKLYRGDRPAPEVNRRCVLLVDDGLATGASMRVAVRALRERGAGEIVVAVPVAPPSTAREIRELADTVVCGAEPEPFFGVGQFYEEFGQTSDTEVQELLKRAADEYLRCEHQGLVPPVR